MYQVESMHSSAQTKPVGHKVDSQFYIHTAVSTTQSYLKDSA